MWTNQLFFVWKQLQARELPLNYILLFFFWCSLSGKPGRWLLSRTHSVATAFVLSEERMKIGEGGNGREMFSLYLLCSLVKVKVKVLLSVKQKVKKCKSKSKSKRRRKREKKVLYLLFLSYFLPILTYSYIFFFHISFIYLPNNLEPY